MSDRDDSVVGGGKGGRAVRRTAGADRIAALHPLMHYGPEYCRGVAFALAHARLCVGSDEACSGEHYLLVAEPRAGL
ncbi:MAG: hypothetical protein ACYCV7_17160 [Acidimicrobiales bacterium]